VAWEPYAPVLRVSVLEDNLLLPLQTLLSMPDFQAEVEQLGGYSGREMGRRIRLEHGHCAGERRRIGRQHGVSHRIAQTGIQRFAAPELRRLSRPGYGPLPPVDEAPVAAPRMPGPSAPDPRWPFASCRRVWDIGTMSSNEPRNIDAALASFSDYWSPRTIAVVNDYDVRIVKVLGEFTRHSHPETDEFFLVLSGHLTIRLDDGDTVLGPGDSYVVPRGRFHQPVANEETTLLLFEPSNTINTGDTPSDLTADS
jgi:mannose-6-phosphate isomerase-like protein (cupin superfamily)